MGNRGQVTGNREQEELLNKAGIELAVIRQLQINHGFGIGLASGVRPKLEVSL
jgi:hypothetical protein